MEDKKEKEEDQKVIVEYVETGEEKSVSLYPINDNTIENIDGKVVLKD